MMRKLIRFLIDPWGKQKKYTEKLLKIAGLKLVKNICTSITLNCLNIHFFDDDKCNIVDDFGFTYNIKLTYKQAVKQIEEYKNIAVKKYKKLSEEEALEKYIGDLRKIKVLVKDIDDYIQFRKKFKSRSSSDTLNNFKKAFTVEELDVLSFYDEIIEKYPKLKGVFKTKDEKFLQRNFADFNLEYLNSSNEKVILKDLVHSGDFALYNDFINFFDNDKDLYKSFKKGVKDVFGRRRDNDSELKYIFYFMKNYMYKADDFIITTKNIYFTCNSCQGELLILKEFLRTKGKKLKLFIYSDEKVNGGDDLYALLQKRKK